MLGSTLLRTSHNCLARTAAQVSPSRHVPTSIVRYHTAFRSFAAATAASSAKMPFNTNAAKNAIIGALTADAATMPLHWIYDHAKLEALLGDKKSTPEFFDPPSCPFYDSTKNPGM